MDFTALEKFMDSLIPFGIPGADIAVHKDGETLFRYYAGQRDREAKLPMRGDELYYMYSCSKPVTVTAALQLFEKGAFLMDDPVSLYLPEFAGMSVREANGTVWPAKHPITMRMLFTMTSGFDYDLQSASIKAAAEKSGGRCPTVEVARALASEPLQFQPGERWCYGLSHDILAALVEVLSGERFADYVRDHIFLPLGMTRSCFHREPDGAFAAQYRMNEATRQAERISLDNEYVLGPDYDSGGAGVISCVDDFIRFGDALANGGVGSNGNRILSRAAIDLMRTNHLNELQLDDYYWSPRVGYGYGLGVRTLIDRTKGGTLSPLGEFGWSGAAGAYLLADPANRISIVYCQHMLNNQEDYVHPRLRNIIYSALEY